MSITREKLTIINKLNNIMSESLHKNDETTSEFLQKLKKEIEKLIKSDF